MMRYSFHPAADRELLEAFNHYQDLGERLGYGFLDEVEGAVRFLLDYPEGAPRIKAEVRRYSLSRFPYSIFYRLRKNHLRILAVAHQSRRPFYWIGRLR